ncbi:hypothetical protein ECG_05087 [Echinococcus granulosus]|nr:hypothetical protein ECG_05087 [Echinococcus granulosus]
MTREKDLTRFNDEKSEKEYVKAEVPPSSCAAEEFLLHHDAEATIGFIGLIATIPGMMAVEHTEFADIHDIALADVERMARGKAKEKVDKGEVHPRRHHRRRWEWFSKRLLRHRC